MSGGSGKQPAFSSLEDVDNFASESEIVEEEHDGSPVSTNLEEKLGYTVNTGNAITQNETLNTESVNWQSVKSSGLDDLETESVAPKKIRRKDLLSHVPTETVVMKYGYVRTAFFLFFLLLAVDLHLHLGRKQGVKCVE